MRAPIYTEGKQSLVFYLSSFNLLLAHAENAFGPVTRVGRHREYQPPFSVE
jgi:hypothetical protein